MRQYTDKFSTSCMMHIAHAAASIPYHDSILMAATIKRLINVYPRLQSSHVSMQKFKNIFFFKF